MSRPTTSPVQIPEQRRVEQEASPSSPTVLVVLPAGDTTGSLPSLASRLRSALPDAGLLVVDDGSPEGTGRIADALAGEETGVHVLHRGGRVGLGTACVAAYSWALDRGYDVVLQLDADGPHTPEELPRLLHALDGADLVVASHAAPGAPTGPKWVTDYARAILGMDARDATSGFRAMRAEVLRALPLREIASAGPGFPVEMVWRALQAGFRVRAVPIPTATSGAVVPGLGPVGALRALLRITQWSLRGGDR
jgi:glycosyltransferase involved in cell wall biosynthesis